MQQVSRTKKISTQQVPWKIFLLLRGEKLMYDFHKEKNEDATNLKNKKSARDTLHKTKSVCNNFYEQNQFHDVKTDMQQVSRTKISTQRAPRTKISSQQVPWIKSVLWGKKIYKFTKRKIKLQQVSRSIISPQKISRVEKSMYTFHEEKIQ